MSLVKGAPGIVAFSCQARYSEWKAACKQYIKSVTEPSTPNTKPFKKVLSNWLLCFIRYTPLCMYHSKIIQKVDIIRKNNTATTDHPSKNNQPNKNQKKMKSVGASLPFPNPHKQLRLHQVHLMKRKLRSPYRPNISRFSWKPASLMLHTSFNL